MNRNFKNYPVSMPPLMIDRVNKAYEAYNAELFEPISKSAFMRLLIYEGIHAIEKKNGFTPMGDM